MSFEDIHKMMADKGFIRKSADLFNADGNLIEYDGHKHENTDDYDDDYDYSVYDYDDDDDHHHFRQMEQEGNGEEL